MGVLCMAGESIDVVIVSLYYLFISKDWSYLVIVITVAHILFGIAQMFVLIESPKKLYTEERYRACYDSLTYMAAFNGVTE